MKDNWLDNLHDKVKDFETDAPDNLWDDIAADLPKALPPKRRRTAPALAVWSRRIAAVAAAAALVVAVTRTGSLQMEPAIAEAPGADGAATADAATLTVHEHIAAAAELRGKHHTQHQLLAAAPAEEIAEATVHMLDEVTVFPPADTADTAPAIPAAMHIRGYRKRTADPPAPPLDHAGSSRVQLGVYTSGSVAAAAGTDNGLYLSADADWMGNSFGSGFIAPESSPYKSSAADIKHHLPVKAGIQVGYRLSDRLTLNTGLVYTFLGSDLEYNSPLSNETGTQTLHYLGVPLSLQCGIASWKRLQFYATAGGAVDKCIAGNIRMQRHTAQSRPESYTESINDKPWQLSLNAGLGLQFDITRTVGIYAEPGVAWYFDDGSGLRTVYDDRPLNFNLNVGLRFTVGQ